MRRPLALALACLLSATGIAAAEGVTVVTDHKARTTVRKDCQGKLSVIEQGSLPAIWSCAEGFTDAAPIPVTLATGERIACDPLADISGFKGRGFMQCSLKRPVILTIKGQETRCAEFVVLDDEGSPRRCWGKSKRLH